MKPVWIVDDDRSIRWVIEKALSREGIAFNSFSSAQDALSALSASAPEVLLSDIRMPGLSGLELLNAVKQRHPGVRSEERRVGKEGRSRGGADDSRKQGEGGGRDVLHELRGEGRRRARLPVGRLGAA